MSRLNLLAALLAAALLLGGCPQDAANLGGSDSAQTAPGVDAPTQGGELLEGPGFSLAMPPGFTLKQQDTPHPGLTYWRYYEDTLGLRGITVGVNKPAAAGPTTLEEVSLRVKGATQSSTGDFLLVARIAASSYFGFESEGAVGLLADGNVLVVQIASFNISGVDELIATGLFTSIDLKDTDGRPLEQRWRETAPTLVARTADGLSVLSDLSTWSLYSDKTSAEVAEVASWNAGDPVFPQILSNDQGVDRGELVHVGHWRPVEVFKVGVAIDATIAQIQGGTVGLSDGSAWIAGTQNTSGWNVGDRLFRVQNGPALTLIHATTSRVVTNPAQALIGPGFQVNLPQRSLEEITDLAPPVGATYWKAFYDSTNDLFYAVAVATPDAAGGSIPIDELSIRIRGGVTTASGDFLLLARLATGGFDGFEADVSIGLLADGRLLYVYLLAERIGAAEELTGASLFTSVNLFDTDGRAIEQEAAEDAQPVIVRASNGMLVLEDLSVWTLPFAPPAAQTQEFNRFAAGDRLLLQTYREEFAFEDTNELVHVGRWVSVEVELESIAIDTTIAAIVDVDTIRLSDGSQWNFTGSVPAGWNVGDRVLRVPGEFSFSSEWLILVETGTAIEFF